MCSSGRKGRVQDGLNLAAVPFMKNLLVLIAPAGHPLANQPGIAPARLAEEAFIMQEQDPLPDSLPNAFFSAAKGEPENPYDSGE